VSPLPDNVRDLRQIRLGGGAWIFERIAEGIEPRPGRVHLESRLRERLLAKIAAGVASRTVRACEGAWQPLAPGVSLKLLREDHSARRMTAWIRMAPGSSLESHRHDQAEECLVIEGEILIGEHRLCAGDLHVANAGTVHGLIRSPQGALLLVHAQSLPTDRDSQPVIV
jgi:quercetin dioxygenase-like cupin family protein